MLRDADPNYFAGIYIICGYTDLRYGIDSLAAIIEQKYKLSLFVPNTLFLFCGRSSSKIKGLLWEGDGFLLLYKRVEAGHFSWPRSSDEVRAMHSFEHCLYCCITPLRALHGTFFLNFDPFFILP